MISLPFLFGIVLMNGTGFGQTLIFNSEMDVRSPQDPRPAPSHVEQLRAGGWACPDSDKWPAWWSPRGSNVSLEMFATGGKQGAYSRISGGGGYIVCPAYPLQQWREWVKEDHDQYGDKFLFSIWVRGKGALQVRFEAFRKAEDGKDVAVKGPGPFTVQVNSEEWVRYRWVVRPDDEVRVLHPGVGAHEGTVDFDELSLWPATPAEALIVAEQERLYGTGALIENLRFATADAVFQERAAAYAEAMKVWRAKAKALDKALDQALVRSLETALTSLDPYVLTPGVQTVSADRYNDMALLTRVLRKLAGAEEQAIQPLTATPANSVVDAPGLYPGRRDPRPEAVTITQVRSNKVRYVENEDATTTATVVNKTAAAVNGTIRARMIVDLDTVRELASGAFALAPGEENTWTFSYNVGPETYGRAIEVEFAADNGETLDAWREYYAVAAEYFRVHQHCYNNETKYWPADFFTFYFNQSHYFAAEPTNFGIEPHSAEVYKASNAGYEITAPHRRVQIAHNKQVGIATTYYVTADFSAQMGYEQARQHPEFVLYDEDGQWAEDSIYGGYPNPMELASPLEIGPKRKELKTKPYLDRHYTPWQHCMVNMASEDAVVWGLERMKQYAEEWGFDGIYWDGCLGVGAGFRYDGVRNVPAGKYEDYVALGARNHRLWNQILKRDNPLFGTWMNWGLEGATGDFASRNGITIWLGSGVGGDDPLDDNVRAATEGRNIMMLDEAASCQGLDYRKLLAARLESRDHYVQKYGVTHQIGPNLSSGCDPQEPGPSKWGWPSWNHLIAIFTATQSHFGSFFVPSHRPFLQFTTRYSRFFWAPDIRTVPEKEAETLLSVTAPEELWWTRLVYRRPTDTGYDLIVHLIRKPATEKVDYTWADEPQPLAGTLVNVDLGSATLQTAHACRPYTFDEEQQTVEHALTPDVRTGKATVVVPPFRYYTMLVFRAVNGE